MLFPIQSSWKKGTPPPLRHKRKYIMSPVFLSIWSHVSNRGFPRISIFICGQRGIFDSEIWNNYTLYQPFSPGVGHLLSVWQQFSTRQWLVLVSCNDVLIIMVPSELMLGIWLSTQVHCPVNMQLQVVTYKCQFHYFQLTPTMFVYYLLYHMRCRSRAWNRQAQISMKNKIYWHPQYHDTGKNADLFKCHWQHLKYGLFYFSAANVPTHTISGPMS